MRRPLVGFSLVLTSIIMTANMFDGPIHIAILAFGLGLLGGAGLFAFAYGVSTVASANMQRQIANQIIRSYPNQKGPPDRVIPPVEEKSPSLTLFYGDADDVVAQSIKYTERKNERHT